MRGSAGGVPLRLPDFQGPAWMHEEQGEAPGETFGVLPENWDAVCAFFACGTQWRVHAGALAGLRYTALDLVIQHLPCADPDDAFRRVQVMERAAVEHSRRNAPQS